ncbi:MAG: hypothetical protein VX498_10110 [Myxococcota bacterium]|nr:hypothetical protein [Myxococcota bacterium]
MQNRHAFTVGLWILSITGAVAFVLVGVPWLWPRLFPVPQVTVEEELQSSEESSSSELTPEYAMEVLRRTLAGLGATGEEPGREIQLPRGKSARDLEQALREDPRLAGAEVYVTQVDDLLYRVRVFRGPTLLLQESVRPWLPERPVVSTADPPELAIIVVFRRENDDGVRQVGQWRAPVAIGVPPSEPHTVRTARQATWSSKGVVVLVSPDADLAEQVGAAAHAGGALLEQAPPEGVDLEDWLRPLLDGDLFLLDASGVEGLALKNAARSLGIRYLRRSAHLDPGDPVTLYLARNLTVRRGHGVVTVDGTDAGIASAETFIEGLRKDGYSLRFAVEVARQHGEGARERLSDR